jgi:acid phosphatase type 7
MNSRDRAQRTLLPMKVALTKDRLFKLKVFSAVVLTIMVIVNVLPVDAVSTSFNANSRPNLQTVSTLTFATEADAFVAEQNPNTNAGNVNYLDVISANNRSIESYMRFTVSGASGTIQSALLRVYCTTDSTKNGPAVYATGSTWSETGITWNNRPARTSGATANKGSISKNTWVEYNVTALVTGNGTYSFVLGGDSNDDVRFSSREGGNPPQLVITFASSAPTATRTSTATQPGAATPTRTPTVAQSPAATFTRTPTAINTQATSTGGTFTFTPVADSYVESSNPGKNYGSVTEIRVDGSPDVRSYLRFNVQGLSGAVTSATLRVYANSAATAGYDARSVSDNTWTESGLIYSNAPPVGSVLGSSGNVTSNTWTSVNVTSYITGNGTYNLGLTTSGSTALSLASRESANDPQLVIQTGGTGPTPTRTSTSVSNPTATRTPTPVGNPTQTPTRTPTRTPTPSSGSVVFLGAGDISRCDNNNDEATAKLLDGISGTVFAAGDNVYDSGTTSEYANCYDPTWGRHKSRTKPVPGNHEYQTSGASGYFQYFNNVSAYYAYNLGNWRIYALNSEIDVSASGAQGTWLQSDLAANPKACVLAYWHKARWSSGSTHGSTSNMQAIWQILYNAGADVVITGHEHNYERFAPMNASGSAVSQGLREFVVGTGGASHYGFGTALSSSQVRNSSTYGVLKLTLNASSYDWQFVPISGSTFTDSGNTACR